MSDDEAQIRDLVMRWMAASKAGDVQAVLQMVTDDVVFLQPGRAPMCKPEFAAISQAQAAPDGPAIDGQADIQEVTVAGDWAFIWNQLRVTVTPPGRPPVERKGHTLTVLRKQDGRWRIARDANLLA